MNNIVQSKLLEHRLMFNLLAFLFQVIHCPPVLDKVSEEDGVHSAGAESVTENIRFHVRKIFPLVIRLKVAENRK